MKKLLLYLLRWQASTPILSVITWLMIDAYGSVISAIVANLIGGLIFFKVDKMIFKNSKVEQERKDDMV